MNLLLATTNAGKAQEIQQFLSDIPAIVLYTLQDFDKNIAPPQETGTSYAQNALQKAMYYFEHCKMPTLAEDSGIEVDALKGELGVTTRRWGAGENASDEEWMRVFLERMKDENNRAAKFIASSCIVFSREYTCISTGECAGTILQNSSTPLQKGIPLSSYFVPTGHSKTFADLSAQEKNSISHRGKSIAGIQKILKSSFWQEMQ